MDINLQTLLVALLTGAVPTFLWLWFWISEDRKHPEPRTMLVFSFLIGVFAVVFTLPVQELISQLHTMINSFTYFFLTAGIEEIIKFGLVYLLISLTPFVDEPIDYAIYLITGALGFAALENTLYLIDPVRSVFSEASLGISSLRFLGSTLLHATTASIIGLNLGLAWNKKNSTKLFAFLVGLLIATVLHAGFNFFIINGTNAHVFLSLVTLWVVAISAMYLFEKVKTIR